MRSTWCPLEFYDESLVAFPIVSALEWLRLLFIIRNA